MHRAWSTYLDPQQQQALLNQQQTLGRPAVPAPGPGQQSMDYEYNSRRASSIASAAGQSTYSQAASTRHLVTDMSTPLDPPNVPFGASPRNSQLSLTPRDGSPLLARPDSTPVSLSVNYLPSKFSTALVTPGVGRRRRPNKDGGNMPKRGGGREAFKSGEARMPGEGDDDYDGINSGWFGGKEGGGAKPRMRWTRFKWIIFFSTIILTMYTLCALVFCLLTWFDVWTHADVVRVGNRTELILSTFAASLGVVVALIGWAGILLNNRSFLAVYSFMLWMVFILLLHTFNLEGKINSQWSRALGADGRLRIQNQLECCGYFSPFVEATVSQTCYARTILPGCKQVYLEFERNVLQHWYVVAFALVPIHIFCMVSALLCSNHVTYRFGKGMMPKAYRLSMNSMAVIMDNYANQLAEQYGTDVASEVMARSRSQINLDAMPTMPYQTGGHQYTDSKYGSLRDRAPEGQ
ncbi:hypothetical protein FIBSPDRAFT_920369 [Athelia psychrophila]|uniref:Tetraspanin Tsp2 n=1 Tax=Athelia psychrophila TaxID=1759441 RepID=A0A166H7X0_9AGAM|nr:hypothetical protein FIBSPDRAFT_920369 [Fibularhizoctonia sp. CBS 109695]